VVLLLLLEISLADGGGVAYLTSGVTLLVAEA
jgi:hypothetical protein